MKRYEVVFETAIYYSVFVTAEGESEAQEKAIDHHFPAGVVLPKGYDIDESWFVGGIVAVRDDD